MKLGYLTIFQSRVLNKKKEKKCEKGDSCLRSHGWLEVIFHPLLFRTKVCKSRLKNGVCLQYGFYCAKAHNPIYVRNLVTLYGENWKQHYDLSGREENVLQLNRNSQRMSMGSNEVIPLSCRMRNGRENYYLSHHTCSIRKQSISNNKQKAMTTMCDGSEDGSDSVESPLLIPFFPHISEPMSMLSLNGEVKSYIDLYNEKTRERETSIVCEDHSFQFSSNTTWCTKTEYDPKSYVSGKSNGMEPLRKLQDDWKNCDPKDMGNYMKMESTFSESDKCTFSESDKENADPCQQYTSSLLFAQQ